MSIEMRPLSGTRPLYVDEPEPFWPAGDDPDLYKLELWRLHKVGLVQGLRSVPCWKCGYLVIQSGLFLELEGRDGYHCRVVSWSDAHNAGILSQPFLRTLSDCWRVRPTYSKSAGYAYLGITCPKCGSLQGDNFVYDNYQGRGGVFSDPEDKSPLEVLPLPVFTDDLRKMGYTEVNLNFGCPSGTVTAKGKGAGMLRDLSKLEKSFSTKSSRRPKAPSRVKTRLGVTSPEEFEAILDLYDRCPICELTIHPRVMRQLYRGEADRAAFAKYLPHCRMPVCYNGDITTPAQLKALEAEFPNLSGIMVGRGIIADPALLRQAVGGAPASKEELRGYLDELYHGYTEAFGMASCAVSRMKAHWHYLIQRFEGSEAFEKQLRKAREGWEYEVVVNQLFTLPLL